MRKLTITMAASAAIVGLSSIGGSASAMTGPGSSKRLLSSTNYERDRRPPATAGGPFVRQDTSITVAGGVAGVAPAGNQRNGVAGDVPVLIEKGGAALLALSR